MALGIFNKQPATVAPLVRPQSSDVIYYTIVYLWAQSERCNADAIPL